MGIGEFFKGIVTGKDIDPEKARQATERIREEKQITEEEKNNFMIEYGLGEMYMNGQLTDEDIDELRAFVDKKTNLNDEEKEILKKEVLAKAEKMAQEKLQQAA